MYGGACSDILIIHLRNIYYFHILFCIYFQNACLQKQNPSLNDLFWKTQRGVQKSHDWAMCLSWWVGRESGLEKREKQACRERKAGMQRKANKQTKYPPALHITASTNEEKEGDWTCCPESDWNSILEWGHEFHGRRDMGDISFQAQKNI